MKSEKAFHSSRSSIAAMVPSLQGSTLGKAAWRTLTRIKGDRDFTPRFLNCGKALGGKYCGLRLARLEL